METLRRWNWFLLFISILFFCACNPKAIPLRGNYPESPVSSIVTLPADSVISRIVSYFDQHNMPIRSLDRKIGLIVSEDVPMTWTYEDKEGHLLKPESFVVIPHTVYSGSNKAIPPRNIVGEWNIRIIDGKISISLFNMQARFSTTDQTRAALDYVRRDGKSTGVFEKRITDLIN